MARLTLWNSIAKRRRSVSDTFYDNGLATLKGYLEDIGHDIEIIDWARDDFFQSLSPIFLTKVLRKIYPVLMNTKNKLGKTVLGLISIQIQEFLSFIQERRLKKHLKVLAYKVRDSKVRIFGVKLWYGEAFKNTQYLISLIKKIAPDVLTIAGGYHVTLYEENILQNSDFDLGVVCEGEYPLEKILEVVDEFDQNWDKSKVLDKIISLAESGEIENLVYLKEDMFFKTRKHETKVYSFKSVPKYTLQENKVRIHVMVESLGCDWGKCSFCVHPYFYKHYSLRGVDEIINEIEEMLKAGIGIFRFAGSDTPPMFGAKIAQKIIDKKLNIVFGMGSRAIKGAKNRFDSLVSAYSTLIKGGLRAVFMGGESGNDFVNKEVMNKGVVFEDLVYSIKAIREAERLVGEKVYLSLAFIYPSPNMGKVNMDDVKDDNLRLLKETLPDSVMITPPGPFLHTQWYNEREKYGFEIDNDIVKQAMAYEYVLYKPPHLWPKLGVTLDGKPFKEILAECSKFRNIVEKELDIPTDISDEHFLMFYAAGVRSKEELKKIKNETMLDVISCNYEASKAISGKVNEFSQKLAAGSRLQNSG